MYIIRCRHRRKLARAAMCNVTSISMWGQHVLLIAVVKVFVSPLSKL